MTPDQNSGRREGVLKYGWGWDGFKLSPGESMPVREVLPTDPDPAAIAELIEAAKEAVSHVAELRVAWECGALAERDGKGGTRSNRNIDVDVRLRNALERIEGTDELPNT